MIEVTCYTIEDTTTYQLLTPQCKQHQLHQISWNVQKFSVKNSCDSRIRKSCSIQLHLCIKITVDLLHERTAYVTFPYVMLDKQPGASTDT